MNGRGGRRARGGGGGWHEFSCSGRAVRGRLPLSFWAFSRPAVPDPHTLFLWYLPWSADSCVLPPIH